MPKSPAHILLVDDDPLLRRLFGAKLHSAGFEVIYAKDGAEGRETARRLQPDLILLDLDMPVMGGMEAAQRLTSEKATKNIPIIFLTNVDLSLEAQEMVKKGKTGVVEYIQKGIDLTEFVKIIEKVLAGHNS